ncbi:MAG: lytic transglycosylase domain-containing protein [Bacteroidales bacterium]|nr:lytic transglycosylase domain-containing protein [Bacteroidales bacterium]
MSRSGKGRTVIAIIGMLSLAAVLAILFIRAADDSVNPAETPEKGKYVVTSAPMPDELDFAGEKTPLENFDVKEGLDRELLINTYWQSHTLLLIKRANRYFPIIEKILSENGIPEDFKYLPVAESDLMNLISPANAVGFWQFRKATAMELGLEVNNEIDERYHLEKSTEKACEFLQRSFELYGSWTMTAASYNMGRTGLNRQIERQNVRDYYDLLLNEETGRYVYRLLALKLIMENPEEYGFEFDKSDLYPPIPTYKITVDTAVKDFAEFAQRYSINYKILKIFNPWLRDNKLTNAKGKTYYLSIPEKGYRNFTTESVEPESGEGSPE